MSGRGVATLFQILNRLRYPNKARGWWVWVLFCLSIHPLLHSTSALHSTLPSPFVPLISYVEYRHHIPCQWWTSKADSLMIKSSFSQRSCIFLICKHALKLSSASCISWNAAGSMMVTVSQSESTGSPIWIQVGYAHFCPTCSLRFRK